MCKFSELPHEGMYRKFFDMISHEDCDGASLDDLYHFLKMYSDFDITLVDGRLMIEGDGHVRINEDVVREYFWEF